ncbi:MAG TPA: GspE/PulE family protein [Candidatus Absconditabacterales bacterium]|nr:GspE/PulE family protein [Candidatus Absconditabacterales bacterium]HPK27752.1 GspE/PulE family protein [Candidatus Absconditabacterales bacterium]
MYEQTGQYREALESAIMQSDVIKIFDNLLTIAVEEGASDIHIEPLENYCRIRIRIDGVLLELIQYPKTLHENIISKFKIESGQMRPDEKRLPQDARVSSVTLTNKEIDMRANTLPTVWGEKLVMRIVDKSKKIPPLSELGLEGSNEKIIYKHLSFPNGIILNTGPTGSGKTTTLYACLDYINKPEINIITYEDPVENKMEGLNQAQVRSDIGFTFANGLRGGLRQDPDIMMVGEIRDKETLDMAMESAMTGHLVFSTVHTNSAIETISRILNLGAKPYMMAGTFNLVIAQRLARKTCIHCAKEIDIKSDEKRQMAKKIFSNFDKDLLKKEIVSRGITKEQWSRFMIEGKMLKGTGKLDGKQCPICGGTGYKGRIGLFELMDYTDDIKNMLIEGKSNMEIEQYALKSGMIDLSRDGMFKTIKGLTDLDEIYRCVKMKHS